MGRTRARGSETDYPEGAHVIRDYATLQQLAASFASGTIRLLLILGGPGKGKGQVVKHALEAVTPTPVDELQQVLQQSLDGVLQRAFGPVDQPPPPPAPELKKPPLYIKGTASPIRFHVLAFHHLDAPICVDDADAFFAKPELRERVKHLTESDLWKQIAHQTYSKQLEREGVPQEFWTKSPVCIIRNAWDTEDPICQAIESRAVIVVFDPSWDEVYRYSAGWYWDQEIFDYFREKIPFLKSPDLRVLDKAYNAKLANIPGMPWQRIIDQHIPRPEHLLAFEFLEADYPSEQKRIDAWIEEATRKGLPASKKTWYRIMDKLEESQLGTPVPERIVLERTAPPESERPVAPRRRRNRDDEDDDDYGSDEEPADYDDD